MLLGEAAEAEGATVETVEAEGADLIHPIMRKNQCIRRRESKIQMIKMQTTRKKALINTKIMKGKKDNIKKKTKILTITNISMAQDPRSKELLLLRIPKLNQFFPKINAKSSQIKTILRRK